MVAIFSELYAPNTSISSQQLLYSLTFMALIHRFPVTECCVYIILYEHDFCEAACHLGAVSLILECCGVDLSKGLPCRVPAT